MSVAPQSVPRPSWRLHCPIAGDMCGRLPAGKVGRQAVVVVRRSRSTAIEEASTAKIRPNETDEGEAGEASGR